jgi:L-ribulose-5-phosphate 3-epimerase
MRPSSVEFLRPRLGVCSWSLRPAGPRDLADKVEQCGLHAVQLALDPIRAGAWDAEATRNVLAERGIQIVSGMMAMAGEDYSTLQTIRKTGGLRPDETWRANLEAAVGNARVAAALGIHLITFHAGFVPHDSDDAAFSIMVDRINKIAEVFGSHGVEVIGLETGQESAATMRKLLGELSRQVIIGVNFDPANMILYGMGDPVEALQQLSPWLAQVHVKDALPTEVPGTWGLEVAAGDGAVRWSEFFELLRGFRTDMIIEREAGVVRIDDVRSAAELVRRLHPAVSVIGHG